MIIAKSVFDAKDVKIIMGKPANINSNLLISNEVKKIIRGTIKKFFK